MKAITLLPNSTALRQILLEDGVAKLDRTQLKDLPALYSEQFQQAEVSARSQHKNIWGDGDE